MVSHIRPRLVLLLCLLAAPSGAVAERPPARLFTAADGLASDESYGVLADSRGFLWFSSAEGLSRFDGYTFRTYTTADGLPDRRVVDIVETRAADYWVATAGGLCRFDPRGVRGSDQPPFVPVRLGEDPKASALTCLLETRDGRLWCGTEEGLYRIAGGGPPERVELGDEGRVYALLEDRWGDVWVGRAPDVRRVRADGRVEAYPLPRELSMIGVELLFEDAAGRLWACTRVGAGVADARASADEPVAFDAGVTGAGSQWLTAYLRASDGTEWVTSTVGLWRISDGAAGPALERVASVSSVCDHAVWDVAEDRDGNLWLATACGALRVDWRGLRGYGAADGLVWDNVNSIFETRSGNLVVTALGPGRTVQRFDGHRFTAVDPAETEEISRSGWGWGWGQTVLEDRDGAWWVPTQVGAMRYAGGGRAETVLRKRPERMTPAMPVFRLFEDSRGDVWIAKTAPPGLYRWERATGRLVEHTEDTGVDVPVDYTAFAETRGGAVWIATGGAGLVRYAGGRFERFAAGDGAPADYLRGLHVDDAGRLWIASNLSGVVRVDEPDAERPTFKRFTMADGLASDNAWCVTTDAYGRVYVGLARGVDRLDPATGRVKHFTADDGLPKGSVQAAFRDRNGRIWFGSAFGLARLDPAPDRERAPPRAVVTGLRVAGVARPVSSLGEASVRALDLGPSENSVSVDFLGIGTSLGEELRYRYKLEGADGDWSAPTPERTVTFANLAAGTYRLLVRAVDADGRASAEPAAVAFTIAAPVWRRWWFLALAAALVGLAGYALHRYRVARLVEVERVRTRIATDLHDDIGSSLSQISVLTEVARRELDGASGPSDRLAMIGEISRDLVDSVSDIVWAINPRRDSVSELANRMRRFASDVFTARGGEFSFRAPDREEDVPVGADVRREVFLVFKEAVNNAVRHSGCSRADIEFTAADCHLELRVTDDGRGFDPGRESDGNGLASMRARAERVGGSAEIVSAPGAGATVRVRVPLRRRGAHMVMWRRVRDTVVGSVRNR